MLLASLLMLYIIIGIWLDISSSNDINSIHSLAKNLSLYLYKNDGSYITENHISTVVPEFFSKSFLKKAICEQYSFKGNKCWKTILIYHDGSSFLGKWSFFPQSKINRIPVKQIIIIEDAIHLEKVVSFLKRERARIKQTCQKDNKTFIVLDAAIEVKSFIKAVNINAYGN